MLQQKETTPDMNKLDRTLDNTELSPLKKKIIRDTVIQYDKALDILSQ